MARFRGAETGASRAASALLDDRPRGLSSSSSPNRSRLGRSGPGHLELKGQSALGPVPRDVVDELAQSRRRAERWCRGETEARERAAIASACATRERKKPRACSKPSLMGSGIVVEPERIEVDRREAQVAGDLDLADAGAREPRILDLRQQ